MTVPVTEAIIPKICEETRSFNERVFSCAKSGLHRLAGEPGCRSCKAPNAAKPEVAGHHSADHRLMDMAFKLAQKNLMLDAQTVRHGLPTQTHRVVMLRASMLRNSMLRFLFLVDRLWLAEFLLVFGKTNALLAHESQLCGFLCESG